MAGSRRVLSLAAVALLALAASGCQLLGLSKKSPKKLRPLGLEKVVAFTYLRKDYDPKQLRSVTFIEPTNPDDWKYWQTRGAVAAIGQTWPDLLKSPIGTAVTRLAGLNYGGNPLPAVAIDEFGFDFGGQTDQKSAIILYQAKHQKPELALAVWQMRGPIPELLARAYRHTADLVMLECYVGNKKDYWWIITQVHAARLHGLLNKSIVVLGLGKGGNPGEEWAQTKEELEQQIRFVRLIAPESPGIGFFAPGASDELLARADELCARYFDAAVSPYILPRDVQALMWLFTERRDKPTLICSPAWVEPNRSADDPGKLVSPKTMRVCLMNLGWTSAWDVKVRLRNPRDKGGDVFAEGVVRHVPKRGEAIAVLPVKGQWNAWKTWDLEIDAPGCEVIVYKH